MNLDDMRLALIDFEPTRSDRCNAARTNGLGYTAVSCSFPSGHAGDHTDVHAGRSWT